MSRTRLALILVCMPLAFAIVAGGFSTALADDTGAPRGAVAVPQAPYVEVTTKTLNVRSNPSTTGSVLGSLKRGQRVMAPGSIEDGWLFVRSDEGVTGYVFAKFVRPVDVSPAAPGAGKR